MAASGPPGPPQTMQPSPQVGVNPAAHPQPSQSQTQADIDPIAKIKQLLLPRLKDSLVNVMKIAGQILHQNSLTEEGHKSQESLQQQHERSLEEFYSICDQLEVNLRLALEMQSQLTDSHRYTPLPVTLPKIENTPVDHQAVSYPQFLITVKQQISCVKDMYDMLTEFTKKLVDQRTGS